MSELLFDWYGGVVGTRLFTAMSGGYVTYSMNNETINFRGCGFLDYRPCAYTGRMIG